MKTIDLKKTGYVSPEVASETVAVESGFASSVDGAGTQDLNVDEYTIQWK